MREILFRGKTNEGKWGEGQLLHFKASVGSGELAVIVEGCEWDNSNEWFNLGKRAKVLPETVGQYSGRTDKNNVKMFENDVVTGLFLHSMPVNGVVAFRDGSFGLLWDRAGAETFTPFTSMCNVEYEVIGNIHDNPELLYVGE